MTTTEAVRDRILHLCEERGLTINRLATICALPPSSIKNILYGKSQNPKILTNPKIRKKPRPIPNPDRIPTKIPSATTTSRATSS